MAKKRKFEKNDHFHVKNPKVLGQMNPSVDGLRDIPDSEK